MEDRRRLLALLQDVRDDVDFAGETALIQNGLIDSLDITVLIAAIDDAFGTHIRVADIEPENFDSVDAMLRLIRQCGAKR